ncbi:MAG: hypothetical protein U0795_04540 [Pirellulales bacterium]
MAHLIPARPLYQAGKRLLVGAVVSALMLTVIGHPKPAAPKPRGMQAYPCQHHQCGCMDAKHCWESCCCMTRTEKLAWARRHSVSPPPELALGTESEEPSPGKPRCGGCCQKTDQPSTVYEADEAPSFGPEGWVIGAHARKCRGAGTEWVFSGASLVTRDEVQVTLPTSTGRYYPEIQVDWFSIVANPDVPPPRILAKI